MFTDYFVRHPKQFRYIKLRKMHSEKVHRHKRKSLSLFQSNYIQLQSVVPSITSWKHTIQAIPFKKKKKEKEKERMKRRRRKGKRWKRGEERKRDGKSLCGRKGKGETRERHNSHKQRSNKSEPESSGKP